MRPIAPLVARSVVYVSVSDFALENANTGRNIRICDILELEPVNICPRM